MTDKKLSAVLGASYSCWQELKKHLSDQYGECMEEWKFYGQKIGWTLKVLRKKRNLFFFTAGSGFFRVAFVFGDKAVSAVEQSNLPRALVKELLNAKKYAEGRGIRLEAKSGQDIENIKKLIRIKIEN